MEMRIDNLPVAPVFQRAWVCAGKDSLPTGSLLSDLGLDKDTEQEEDLLKVLRAIDNVRPQSPPRRK